MGYEILVLRLRFQASTAKVVLADDLVPPDRAHRQRRAGQRAIQFGNQSVHRSNSGRAKSTVFTRVVNWLFQRGHSRIKRAGGCSGRRWFRTGFAPQTPFQP